VRAALALALLLLAVSPAAGQEASPDEAKAAQVTDGEPAKRKPIRVMVLPNAAFDTDDGFGFGLRAELQKLAPGYEPYQAGFVLHAYMSLRGFHHHRFYVDLPGLGPRHRTRVWIRLAFRQWMNDGYWGVGNGTFRERAFVGSFDKEDPARTRYRYWLMQPYGWFGVRHDLGDSPFALYGSLTLQWTRVSTYAGSVLEEQRPRGMDGGFTAQLLGGFLVDTRSPEIAPDRGFLAEVSARFAPDFPGSAGAYGGPFVSIRGYVGLGGCGAPWPGYVTRAAQRRKEKLAGKGKDFPLPEDPFPGCRAVLAMRAMGEWLVGDVPFFEMTRWGGAMPILGFGGYETLRGAPFGRWRAPGRAIGNVELRIDVVRHRLFREPLRWQLVPFADVGVVWGAGEHATAPAPDFPLHPAVGLGVHLVWAEAFVARVDLAVGPDPIREADGSLTQAPNVGFYLMFDQTY
jgi:hypothetical protein